ncbi:hypothetical protein K4E_20050 [Enterococcus thailandicus]|nr:hypothetical protein K4E_20050 [Enterococcus thailandicus]
MGKESGRLNKKDLIFFFPVVSEMLVNNEIKVGRTYTPKFYLVV